MLDNNSSNIYICIYMIVLLLFSHHIWGSIIKNKKIKVIAICFGLLMEKTQNIGLSC